MTLTDKLNEIEKLAEKATSGPWRPGLSRGSVVCNPTLETSSNCLKYYGGTVICESAHADDMSFILASRTLVPQLVAALKMATGALSLAGRYIHAQFCSEVHHPKCILVKNALTDIAAIIGEEKP